MEKLRKYIYEHKHYQSVTDRLRTTYVSRKHRINLHRFLEIFFTQIRKDAIAERASGMAFSFLLSMFPAIIFIFTLIPYIPIPDLESKVIFSLKQLLPTSIYKGAAAAIYDILHIPHGGLLSFGFAFAIWSATNGIMAMTTAFNRCYRTLDKRSYIKRAGIAVSIVFLLLAIVFSAIFVAVMTKHYVSKLHIDQQFLFYLVTSLKYIFFFVAFFIAISMVYYFAPAIHERWRFFSAGSLIASLLIVGFTFGFAYYVNSFDSYNKLYGSLGALIGIMLWIYAISIVLLLGFEINASYDLAKRESQRRTY